MFAYKIIKITRLNYLLLACCLSLFIGCGGSGSSNDGPAEDHNLNNAKAQLVGRVSATEALSGVIITVNGHNTTTDSDGFFILPDITIPKDNRWVVDLTKAGYVATQKIVELSEDKNRYSIDVLMTEPDISTQVDLTQDQTITLNQDQLSISLPANAVQGGGINTTVSLTYGDPSSERGKAIFPGDYSATNNLNEASDIILESIGFMDISVTSEDGNDLSTLNEPATVSLRLPAIYQAGGAKEGTYNENDTIEWWSYNEDQGIWLREDADPSTTHVIDNAQITNVNGVLFANAKVTHFSWWNVDQPIEEHACITVKVIDKDDQAMSNFLVTVEGVSFEYSGSALTDANGYVSLTVKRTLNPTSPETFRLFAEVGAVAFEYDVTSATEGDVSNDILYSPTTIGSSVKGEGGTCTLLENTIKAFYKGTINGIVTNHADEPQEGITVYNNLGESVTTTSNGSFSFAVPHNTNVYIIIPQVFTEQHTTNDANPVVNLEIVLGNQAPTIDELLINPTSNIEPGQTVSLTVNASDADGDSLSYQWTASAGALINETAQTAQWTVPTTTSGTAEINITIRDSANNKVSEARVLTWSTDTTNEEDFFVQAKRYFFSPDGVVEGIAVVLHGVDGKSIEKEVITGADGIANFGKINRDRITISIIEQHAEQNQGNIETQYSAVTYMNIKQAPISYWVSNGENIFSGMFSCKEDERTTYQATFINIPQNVGNIFISGNHNNNALTPEENKVFDIILCTAMVNDPNRAIIANGYSDASLLSLDLVAHSQAIQMPDMTPSIVFDMSKTPIKIPYINNTGSPITVSASSTDSLFQLLFAGSDSTNQTITLYDLPSTSYSFHAETDERDANGDLVEDIPAFYSQSWIEDKLPLNVVVNKPSFSAQNIIFNNASNHFSWETANSSTVDSTSLLLEGDTVEGNTIEWDIVMSSDITSASLPSLPQRFMDIFDTSNFNKWQLQLSDNINYQGLDAVIEKFLDIDIEHLSEEELFFNEANRVTYNIDNNPE